MSANIALYGLGGVAAFGGIFFIIQKFLSRDPSKKLKDLLRKEKKQAVLEHNIKTITKEQQIIAAQVKAAEYASEETKKKIQDKLKKVAGEIRETLKQDSFAAIDDQIEEDWKDL